MDSDYWTTRLTTSSRRSQSRSDLFLGRDEIDVDDETRPEYICPFCTEDFDIVGLCCHIDEEHPVEAQNGVCPVCTKRVGMDLVGHMTMQHGNLLRVQRKRRLRKGGSGGSYSTLSMLRKELRDGNLHSLLGGSSVSSSNIEPDPLLSQFIYNQPVINESSSAKSNSTDAIAVKQSSPESLSERHTQQQCPMSEKDQEEKAWRCGFVQGLLLSTFLGDDL